MSKQRLVSVKLPAFDGSITFPIGILETAAKAWQKNGMLNPTITSGTISSAEDWKSKEKSRYAPLKETSMSNEEVRNILSAVMPNVEESIQALTGFDTEMTWLFKESEQAIHISVRFTRDPLNTNKSLNMLISKDYFLGMNPSGVWVPRPSEEFMSRMITAVYESI